MNRVGMADPSHVIRSWPPSTRRAAASLTLVIAGILAYSNALDGPFLFDDVPAIVDNGERVMVPPHIEVGARIVVNIAEATYAERAKD